MYRLLLRLFFGKLWWWFCWGSSHFSFQNIFVCGNRFEFLKQSIVFWQAGMVYFLFFVWFQLPSIQYSSCLPFLQAGWLLQSTTKWALFIIHTIIYVTGSQQYYSFWSRNFQLWDHFNQSAQVEMLLWSGTSEAEVTHSLYCHQNSSPTAITQTSIWIIWKTSCRGI